MAAWVRNLPAQLFRQSWNWFSRVHCIFFKSIFCRPFMPKQNHKWTKCFGRHTWQTKAPMTMMEPRRTSLHGTFGNLHTYLHFREAQLPSVSGAAGLSDPHWQANAHLRGPVRPRLRRCEMDVNSLCYLYHAGTVLKLAFESLFVLLQPFKNGWNKNIKQTCEMQNSPSFAFGCPHQQGLMRIVPSRLEGNGMRKKICRILYS